MLSKCDHDKAASTHQNDHAHKITHASWLRLSRNSLSFGRHDEILKWWKKPTNYLYSGWCFRFDLKMISQCSVGMIIPITGYSEMLESHQPLYILRFYCCPSMAHDHDLSRPFGCGELPVSRPQPRRIDMVWSSNEAFLLMWSNGHGDISKKTRGISSPTGT